MNNSKQTVNKRWAVDVVRLRSARLNLVESSLSLLVLFILTRLRREVETFGADAPLTARLRPLVRGGSAKVLLVVGSDTCCVQPMRRLLVSDRVFGCHLLTLCQREGATVPRFVHSCLDAVEKRGMLGTRRTCRFPCRYEVTVSIKSSCLLI